MLSRFSWTSVTARWNASQFGLQHSWITPTNLVKNSFTRFYSSLNVYNETFIKAAENPELFWSEAAQNTSWSHTWTKTLDCTDKVFPKW